MSLVFSKGEVHVFGVEHTGTKINVTFFNWTKPPLKPLLLMSYCPLKTLLDQYAARRISLNMLMLHNIQYYT